MRERWQNYLAVRRAMRVGPFTEIVILTLIFMAMLSEGLGLSMLFPVIQLLQPGQSVDALVDSHRLWEFIVGFFTFIGVPITLGSLLAVSFVGIAVRQVFMFWRVVYIAHLHEWIMRKLRNETFERFMRARADVHDREQPGAVANAMIVELNLGVQSFLNLFSLAAYGVMSAFYMAFLVLIAGPVTVLIVAAIGCTILVLKRLIQRTSTSGREMADANEEAMAFLGERLRSARFIKLCNAVVIESRRLAEVTRRQYDANMRIKRSVAAFATLMEPVALGLGFLFVYLANEFMSIRLEEAAMFGFIAFMRLLPVVKETASTWQGVLANWPTLENFLTRYARLAEAVEPSGGTREFSGDAGAIELRNVGYAYPARPELQVLKNFSAHFPAGQLTLLAGPSGSGKSTALDLIMRLRDPASGEIFLDGVELAQYSVSSIRHGIAYVSQSQLVLGSTIRSHLAYGSHEADDATLMQALEQAGVAQFVAQLPDGLDTVLGNEGTLMSGGQRQRLDLARGLAHQSNLLLLDEPTSNLDNETEQRFFRTVRELQLARKMTVVLVSHELSAIEIADHVVVVESGQVRASGNPSQHTDASGWLRDQIADRAKA